MKKTGAAAQARTTRRAHEAHRYPHYDPIITLLIPVMTETAASWVLTRSPAMDADSAPDLHRHTSERPPSFYSDRDVRLTDVHSSEIRARAKPNQIIVSNDIASATTTFRLRAHCIAADHLWRCIRDALMRFLGRHGVKFSPRHASMPMLRHVTNAPMPCLPQEGVCEGADLLDVRAPAGNRQEVPEAR